MVELKTSGEIAAMREAGRSRRCWLPSRRTRPPG